MSVLVLNREYTPIERHLDRNITWLLGNVGTWQKLRLEIEVGAFIEFSLSNTLNMEEPNRFILNNGEDWREHGFEVGDNFIVYWEIYNITSQSTTTYNVTGSIASIQGSEMLSNNTTLGAGAQVSSIFPTQFGEDKIQNVYIAADKKPESLFFRYGHMKNSEIRANNLRSLIDGTYTDFIAEDLFTLPIGGLVNFTPLGKQSGMSISRATLTYGGTRSGGVPAHPYTKYRYFIELIFMPSVFFEDLNTFIDSIAPEAFLNAESMADNYFIQAFPVQNNPNVFMVNNLNDTAQEGNVGWFDENYNGFPQPHSISSVEYRTPANTITQQLDYAGPTFLTVVVDGVQNLSNATKCTFGFMLVPTGEEDYKVKEAPFYKNVKMNTGGRIDFFGDVFTVGTLVAGPQLGYSNDDARMDAQNIAFTQTGINQITFTCEFMPNSDFANQMDALGVDDRNYIIWIGVGDQTLVANASDRTNLLVDFNQMDTYVEPIGAWDGMSIDLLSHVDTNLAVVNPCGIDVRIEDDLRAKIQFQVETATGVAIPIPTGLRFGVQIERLSDGFAYELDNYTVGLTDYPDPSQYAFSAQRDYQLGVGNPNDDVTVDYYPALDSGTKKGVQAFFGFMIRWEDWLSLRNVPIDVRNVFYDNALPSNGLSNDWYRYLQTSGWQLSLFVHVDAILNSNRVRYINAQPIEFKDYDSNLSITTAITYKIASTGVVVTGGIDPVTNDPLGVILSDEKIQIEIEYNRSTGTWGSVADIYSLTSIEVKDGSGRPQYRQISTEFAVTADNPLESSLPTNLLEIILVSPVLVRTICLVEPNKLESATAYKITGRIGCKPA